MNRTQAQMEDAYPAGKAAAVEALLESGGLPVADIIVFARRAVREQRMDMARVLLPHVVDYQVSMGVFIRRAVSTADDVPADLSMMDTGAALPFR